MILRTEVEIHTRNFVDSIHGLVLIESGIHHPHNIEQRTYKRNVVIKGTKGKHVIRQVNLILITRRHYSSPKVFVFKNMKNHINKYMELSFLSLSKNTKMPRYNFMI